MKFQLYAFSLKITICKKLKSDVIWWCRFSNVPKLLGIHSYLCILRREMAVKFHKSVFRPEKRSGHSRNGLTSRSSFFDLKISWSLRALSSCQNWPARRKKMQQFEATIAWWSLAFFWRRIYHPPSALIWRRSRTLHVFHTLHIFLSQSYQLSGRSGRSELSSGKCP